MPNGAPRKRAYSAKDYELYERLASTFWIGAVDQPRSLAAAIGTVRLHQVAAFEFSMPR
jgi:hypothetical protein